MPTTASRSILAVQVFTFIAIAISAGVSAINSYRDYKREGVDRTFRSLEPLRAESFVRNLWAIEEFTICFEKKFAGVTGANLSYSHPDTARKLAPEQEKLVKEWWRYVEEEPYLTGLQDKPSSLELRLWQISSRFSVLAACLEKDYCRYDTYFDAADSIDATTFLGFSNYLLGAEENSLGWSADPNLNALIHKTFDKYNIYMQKVRLKLQNRKVKCQDFDKRFPFSGKS